MLLTNLWSYGGPVLASTYSLHYEGLGGIVLSSLLWSVDAICLGTLPFTGKNMLSALGYGAKSSLDVSATSAGMRAMGFTPARARSRMELAAA